MGVSWKMRFLVVQAFQRELLARNEARNPPHPAHYVLDRLSEFIDAVRHGNFDQILIYQKRGQLDIPVQKHRDLLYLEASAAINP